MTVTAISSNSFVCTYFYNSPWSFAIVWFIFIICSLDSLCMKTELHHLQCDFVSYKIKRKLLILWRDAWIQCLRSVNSLTCYFSNFVECFLHENLSEISQWLDLLFVEFCWMPVAWEFKCIFTSSFCYELVEGVIYTPGKIFRQWLFWISVFPHFLL